MEAPTSVSALLHAATMVKAGIYLLARFILIFSVAPVLITALGTQFWFATVSWIGVLTAIVGATLALTTTDIKGVLAYSTVSQIGFMMAGLGAAVDGAASIGWFASLFHMVSHAFFEGLGFLLAGGIIHAIGTRDMRLMGGLRKAMPISFILMAIMIITTSGLPPFAAFFSKGLIISSVTDAGYLAQAIILYATAAITFAYVVRMFSLAFMGKESEHIQKQHVHEAPKVMLIPAAILAGLCIVWGLSETIVASFMHVNLGEGLLSCIHKHRVPHLHRIAHTHRINRILYILQGLSGDPKLCRRQKPSYDNIQTCLLLRRLLRCSLKGNRTFLRWPYTNRKCPVRTLPRQRCQPSR